MCNCRNPSACPFDGECQTPAVIYQGDVTAEGEPVSEYVGLSEPKVKERASDHHTSFNGIRYENKTELSKRVWELKLKTKQPVVKLNGIFFSQNVVYIGRIWVLTVGFFAVHFNCH